MKEGEWENRSGTAEPSSVGRDRDVRGPNGKVFGGRCVEERDKKSKKGVTEEE